MRTQPQPPAGAPIPSPRRIKNEAASIRRTAPSIKHHEALDRAAKARGWDSYSSLERAWKKSGRARNSYVVRLTARWVDRDGSRGTLNADVRLSGPWENHLPLPVRRRTYTLGQFRIARGDRTHLVAGTTFLSALSCMHDLSKAARQLIFVDELRVHPASLTKAVAAFDGDPYKMLTEQYPNQDHSTLWCDPASGFHFILNEPYSVNSDKQAPVLASKGMEVHTTRDWTTHNPMGTLAQLIAPRKDAELLETLVERSRNLPQRFALIRFTDQAGAAVDLFP